MNPSNTAIRQSFTPPTQDTLSPFWVLNPKSMSNFLIFLSFLSPAIIAGSLLILGFALQNYSGAVYVGFLMAACVLRSILFSKTDIFERLTDNKPVCNAIKYTNIGNNTFSVFVLFFTLSYFSVPMFINNNVNWVLFAVMIAYGAFDVGVKVMYKCIEKTNGVQLGVDILFGTFMAVFFTTLMMQGGAGKYLFFSDQVPSDNQQCSKPGKQQFKCAVYKNGQVIANV